VNLYYFFLAGNWAVTSLFLTVLENARMPENYIFVMDYEYQEKKEGCLLAELSKSIYCLLDFTNYFFYVNTNSGG
jgi:hypothetical protein